MSEVVTALHRFDLPAASGLAAQRGAKVFLVDPVLHGRALAAGVMDPQVHTRSSVDVARAAFSQAQASTRSLCRDLGQRLQAIAPAAIDGSWSAHRIFHLFWTLYGYERIWPEAVAQHEHGHWHVLLPQLAHTYGTHSFLPGLLLLKVLRERGIAHGAYSFECPGLDAYQLPDLRNLAPDAELLVHLPTCGHDAAYVATELKGCGLRTGVLSSQMYDVALEGQQASGLVDLSTVRELLGSASVARVQALEPVLKEVLLSHLQPHIVQPRFLHMQVQALWEALEVQALFHLWLEQHFGAQSPRQLLISNHDATVHGALTSFARQRQASITVLPHSRVHNVPIKTDGARPLCLHHGLQDGPSLDLADQVLPSGLLHYPGDWVEAPAQGSLATLGLVLNGISANGMCCVDFERYVQGVGELRDWALQRGLGFKLRVRMVETPVALLAERLRLNMDELMLHAQGSLVDFGRGCDLCLGYDVPTSGLQDLVREGIAVMQGEFRPLARAEWSIVDERVMPRYSLPELMDRLAVLQSSQDEFRQFRLTQWRLARESQQGAQPLSAWLRAQHTAD